VKPTFFRTTAEFRAWLEKHHGSATELLVGFHKERRSANRNRTSMTYQTALDEALAFGWIDGVRRRIDEDRWSIRFTPRRPRSIWSNVNIRHVTRLIAEGRMAPAGLRAYEARSAARSGIYGYEREPRTFDAPATRALAANARAKAFFDAQPPGYRRIMTHWVMSAKKEETRARRLARLIDRSSHAERVNLLKPNA
jgi:uncharacterized protein YdeI (YjbR/CyaY-like superfamily)